MIQNICTRKKVLNWKFRFLAVFSKITVLCRHGEAFSINFLVSECFHFEKMSAGDGLQSILWSERCEQNSGQVDSMVKPQIKVLQGIKYLSNF